MSQMPATLSPFIPDESMAWEEVGPGLKRKIMAWNPGLMLVKVVFEKGAVGALHRHVHTQITHIESGSFDVEIGGVKQVLSAWDAFHVPSDVLHGVVCLEAGTLIDVFNPAREDFIAAQV